MKIINLFSKEIETETVTTPFALLTNFYNYKSLNSKNKDTCKTYTSYFKHLARFEILKEIHHSKITQQITNKMATALLVNKSSSYTKRVIGFLKASYNHAYQLGEIESNPFLAISLPKASFEKRKPLTPAELKLLFSNYNNLTPKLQRVADIAQFQVSTGLAYCDLKRVRHKWLERHQGELFLIDKRQKSKTEFCIPIKKGVYNYLVSVNFSVPVMTNQKYNAYLKELAQFQGVKINFTSHDLRVTYSQIQINKGYSLESVARMLGHERVHTTLTHYAKLSKERVINEVLAIK